jgi:hypothetical protein
MKKILTTISLALLSLGMAPVLASASPGDAQDLDRIEILRTASTDCPVKVGMCMTAGARTTSPAPSQASASVGSHAGAGATPRFARVSQVGAPASGAAALDESLPWTVDIDARLQRLALAGNAVFLIYDVEVPKALETHEVTAAWQATIPAGDRVSARLNLSMEDGFRAGHTYRIRVVQIVRGKEFLLAEGQVKLL